MLILSWFIGLICLVAVVGLITFPILAIVSGIREAKKPKVEGQKSRSKTILFVVLTIVSFFALVLGIIGWSVLSYTFSVAPSVM